MDFPATARRLNQRYRPSKHHVSRDKALADWLEMRRPRFLFDSKFCLSHNANYAPPKSPDFDTFKPPVVSESPADMPPDAMQETLLLDEVCHQARGEPELDMDVEDNREPLQVLEYKQWSPLAPQRTVNIQAHEGLPPDFIRATKRRLQEGRLTTDAAQYYLNFSHWDSTTVPGQQGRPSFLKDIMAHDRREKQGPGWRPKRLLGQGSFGKVVLWEKDSRQGPPHRLATKDTKPHPYFLSYCHEAALTRRLNEARCPNIIRVQEWSYKPPCTYRVPDGTIRITSACHRICYEYAEFGDLWSLGEWYWKRKLLLPEVFLWHVLEGLARALCWLRWGCEGPRRRAGWDPIYHGDVKPGNVFFASHESSDRRGADQLYPCVKLGDFGLAFGTGVDVTPDVLRLKSIGEGHHGVGGTLKYAAPELLRFEEVGSHSDVYSVGVAIGLNMEYADRHIPPAYVSPDHPSHGRAIEKARSVYSHELRALVDSCLAQDQDERVGTWELYQTARYHCQRLKKKAEGERIEALRGGWGKWCFASCVLFGRMERRLFDGDPEFQKKFVELNREGVWKKFGREAYGVDGGVDMAQTEQVGKQVDGRGKSGRGIGARVDKRKERGRRMGGEGQARRGDEVKKPGFGGIRKGISRFFGALRK